VGDALGQLARVRLTRLISLVPAVDKVDDAVLAPGKLTHRVPAITQGTDVALTPHEAQPPRLNVREETGDLRPVVRRDLRPDLAPEPVLAGVVAGTTFAAERGPHPQAVVAGSRHTVQFAQCSGCVPHVDREQIPGMGVDRVDT